MNESRRFDPPRAAIARRENFAREPAFAPRQDLTPAPPGHITRAMTKEPKESRHKDAHERRRSLEETILDLCAEAGPQKTIDPSAAAKAFAQGRGEDGPTGWRNWLVHVRSAAVGLARNGRLVIYRKGKPADPDDFRGVYRLGLPRPD